MRLTTLLTSTLILTASAVGCGIIWTTGLEEGAARLCRASATEPPPSTATLPWRITEGRCYLAPDGEQWLVLGVPTHPLLPAEPVLVMGEETEETEGGVEARPVAESEGEAEGHVPPAE